MQNRIGEILRRARTSRNLSQGMLSKLAGVSQASISQVENGRRGLSAQAATNLARTLGLDLKMLLGESPTLVRVQGELSAWRAYEDARRAYQGLCHYLADLRDGLAPFETRLSREITDAKARGAFDQLLSREPDFVESQRQRVLPKELRVEYLQNRSAVSIDLTQRLRDIISTVELLDADDQDLILALVERLAGMRVPEVDMGAEDEGGGG